MQIISILASWDAQDAGYGRTGGYRASFVRSEDFSSPKGFFTSWNTLLEIRESWHRSNLPPGASALRDARVVRDGQHASVEPGASGMVVCRPTLLNQLERTDHHVRSQLRAAVAQPHRRD